MDFNKLKFMTTNIHTDINVLDELQKLDEEVYNKELQGTDDAILTRFLACPNLYTVAIYENELIGYICYFPITDSLYDSISDADRFYNNNIRAHDIADLDKDFDNHIYLLSVAIRKEYQERGIGSSLMLKMLDAINHNIKNDYAISDITATAVDDRSGRLLQKYGFTTIGNLYEHNEYKLMQLRLTKGR